MIKLGFYGATGEVTGSCYVLTTDRAQVMIDMGMHQGEREADEHNRRLPPVDPAQLDAVVLTHAHLDHCGRLPLLTKNGYRGKIHCTDATADVTAIILRDSAGIQAEDCLRVNDGRKVQRLAGADGRSKSVAPDLLVRIRKADLRLPNVSSLTIRERSPCCEICITGPKSVVLS